MGTNVYSPHSQRKIKENKVSYVGGGDAWRVHIKDEVKIYYNIKVDFKSITKLKSASKLLYAMLALQ